MSSRRLRKPARPPATLADEPSEARLAVNLPSAVHRALKQRAAERGVSIRQLVLEMLERGGIR